MGLGSKNITILLVSSIITSIFVLAPIFNEFGLNNFITIYIIILAILFCVGGILWAFYDRSSELKKDLETLKFEQKRLGEKLKIYERLSKIEVKLGI